VSASPTGIERARAVKATLAEQLAGDARVNGLGLTRTESGWAVKVNLVRAAPELDLPPEIDGVEVRTHVVGTIKAD
jgi:hypothetical protein